MNQSKLDTLLMQHTKLVHELRMVGLVEARKWLLDHPQAKHVMALVSELEKLMPMERHYGARVDELLEEIEAFV